MSTMSNVKLRRDGKNILTLDFASDVFFEVQEVQKGKFVQYVHNK